MKYLYQQLIAFLSVMLLIFIVISTSFTQSTKNTIQKSNYQQLLGFATSAMKNAADRLNYNLVNTQADVQQALNDSFKLTEQILETQDVHFIYIDKNMVVQYPNNSKKEFNYTLIEKEWENLMKGNNVYKTADTDIYGEKNTSSYVMQPAYLSKNNEEAILDGVVVVTQPAQNVTDSVTAMTSNLFKGVLISGVVAVIMSYFLASFQVKRINRMRKATKEIASGNFDIKLVTKDKDEFDDLAEDFNKMAASLKDSEEEIERQEERRRQFMADASHEMRTPLTTINGLLEGLQYNAIPEDQKENAIKLMQNETSRLIRLVNENLDYEKIRTNQISIVVKKFNATETLTNILTQMEGKAETSNDRLILETEEPIDVYADYDRFVQIVVNIIQNAIQFTKDGEIRISLEKGYLETIVKISDNGIGMSKEQAQNIWDRYYKVDPSRKNTKYGESGLGLSIVQQLVLLHKGNIQVESELGEGTTFTITFPDIEITE